MVTRAAVLAEGIPGGFSAVYGELRLMEEAGRCQRGYFVEGLGGAQFAVTDGRRAAARRARRPTRRRRPSCSRPSIPPTRTARRCRGRRRAASWPASPAPGSSWPAGRPALYVERGGRGLVTLEPELLEPAIAALAGLVESGRVRRLAPERVDGEPIAGTEAERLLLEHGFLQGHRKLVLRA